MTVQGHTVKKQWRQDALFPFARLTLAPWTVAQGRLAMVLGEAVASVTGTQQQGLSVSLGESAWALMLCEARGGCRCWYLSAAIVPLACLRTDVRGPCRALRGSWEAESPSELIRLSPRSVSAFETWTQSDCCCPKEAGGRVRQRVGALSLPGDTVTCRAARLGEGSLCRGPEREPILGTWAQATERDSG